MTLTEKQRKKYVDGGGLHCPFCDSMELQVGHQNMHEDGIWVNVTCRDCGKELTEQYALVDVEAEKWHVRDK